MTDDLVKQALAELGDVVRCRCHEAYTGRGMHDPDCQCDSADAVKAVSEEIAALQARVAELEKKDCEAATYVESVIAMRTGFTGDPPYVGWKGLGLALNEALDAKKAAEARTEEAVKTLRVGFKSCDPTKTAAAIILAIAQLEGHGE